MGKYNYLLLTIKHAFQSEVRILSRLSDLPDEENEFFLKLYEIYEGEQTFYLVTELLEGKTL